MKYDFLKKGTAKSLKIGKLNGGLNAYDSPVSINDNQLSGCKNVWFKQNSLQTRPGLSCNISKALETEIWGYSCDNKYKFYKAGLFLNGEYNRIATAEVCCDDSAYFCNVFLVGDSGNYTSIGRLTFFRITSEVFYIPVNIIFYTGKPQNGGGIFAMATLQNNTDPTDRYYEFYEINIDFTEWGRVNNFYIPVLYINGRGNKYELAKSNNQINTTAPRILESPNMLNGRFHAYFTSDGFSNSFRLPFVNLASENIVCRIYYNLVDYVQWQINGNTITNTQEFFGNQVTMEVDREKGTVYFYTTQGDYAIPVMSMYNENNIKITATKEIENGIDKIMHSTCVLQHKSRIMISGGESGNEIFVTSYENPLYFPQNSSVKVGREDSEVIDLLMQDSKVIVLKQDGIYSLVLKEGKRINEISLLADNDKVFYESDSYSCYEISKQIGCKNSDCTSAVNNNTVFLGNDDRLYMLTSVSGDNLFCISQQLGKAFEAFKNADFAFSGDNKYIILKDNNAFIAIFNKDNEISWYYWQFPDTFRISGGFFSNNIPAFLCSGIDTELSYIAFLDSFADEFLDYDEDGNIVKNQTKVESKIVTKHFNCPNRSNKFESIYLALASKGNIVIKLNDKQIADLNLRLNNKEYQNLEYKSVKLMPYVSKNNLLYVTVSSTDGISLGELEINYI